MFGVWCLCTRRGRRHKNGARPIKLFYWPAIYIFLFFLLNFHFLTIEIPEDVCKLRMKLVDNGPPSCSTKIGYVDDQDFCKLTSTVATL